MTQYPSITPIRLFLISFMFSVLSGCVSIKVVGKWDNNDELFIGNEKGDFISGTSTLKLKGQQSGVVCTGNSEITFIPPDSFCAGQRGMTYLTCDDGRRPEAEFILTACTAGYGKGKDQYGDAFRYLFGFDEEEASKKITEIDGYYRYIENHPISEQKARISSAHSNTGDELAEALTILLIGVSAYYGAYNSSILLPDYSAPLKVFPSNVPSPSYSNTDPSSKTCINDTGCDIGSICIKDPYSFSGKCKGKTIVNVPSTGKDKFYNCDDSGDCPDEYFCDKNYHACVKRK